MLETKSILLWKNGQEFELVNELDMHQKNSSYVTMINQLIPVLYMDGFGLLEAKINIKKVDSCLNFLLAQA